MVSNLNTRDTSKRAPLYRAHVLTVERWAKHLHTQPALLKGLPTPLHRFVPSLIGSVLLPLPEKATVFAGLCGDINFRGLGLKPFFELIDMEYRYVLTAIKEPAADEIEPVQRIILDWYRCTDVFEFMSQSSGRRACWHKSHELADELGLDTFSEDYVAAAMEKGVVDIDTLRDHVEGYVSLHSRMQVAERLEALGLPRRAARLSRAVGPAPASTPPAAGSVTMSLPSPENATFFFSPSPPVGEPRRDENAATLGDEMRERAATEIDEDFDLIPDDSSSFDFDSTSEDPSSFAPPPDEPSQRVEDEDPSTVKVVEDAEAIEFRSIRHTLRLDKIRPKHLTVLPITAPVIDEAKFYTLLGASMSLGLEEKLQIIDSIPGLRPSQIEDLVRIFDEEQRKFVVLGANHDKPVSMLRAQRRGDWDRILEMRWIKYL